ncbi:MAG: 5-oxoprolinase subunit PxpB [Acidobacteriaceae bacterium]|nr:5-oxoprolinase subunit PxpB [Acidobacteriaceae bacterium]
MEFRYSSDRTLLVSLGDRIALDTHYRVLKFLRRLESSGIRAIRNLSPAYCSVMVHFDPCATSHEELEVQLRELVCDLDAVPLHSPNRVEIPVCYGGEFGPDLPDVAALHGLTTNDVIRIHSESMYHVYFLGFVPGFGYLGGLPDSIATPRLPSPRKRVEVGSVGIAGNQTGIYPRPTPGGWRLIGRTPLQIFRADRNPMSLLSIGDEVRFRAVTLEEFRELEAGAA